MGTVLFVIPNNDDMEGFKTVVREVTNDTRLRIFYGWEACKLIDLLLHIKSTDFTAMKVNVVIFGIMTLCNFIGGYRRFGGT
jgi:hypothetical protein